jgi:hypothetical protein
MSSKLITCVLIFLVTRGFAQGTVSGYTPVTITEFAGEVLTYKSGLGSLELSSEAIVQELIAMNQARDLSIDERFARAIPLKIVLEVGASNLVADLSDLNLQELDLSVDLASAEVTLPAQGETVITLAVGAGGVLLKVPSSRSVEVIKSEANLASLTVSESLTRHRDNSVALSVEIGLGNVEVEAVE